jgi:hypothetical protein
MSAVVDRVACPECGAQKGQPCRVPFLASYGPWTVELQPHDARREALWNLNRRIEAQRQRPASEGREWQGVHGCDGCCVPRPPDRSTP